MTWLAPFLFFLFAVVAIAAALGMLLSRNPIHSALWLIANLFCVAGLYVTLNAQFMGVIQVLVYAGAIMVLFLFVIMLLNLAELPKVSEFNWKAILAFVVGTLLVAQLAFLLAEGMDALPGQIIGVESYLTGLPRTIAFDLFTRYVIPVQVIGILLLVATIGAVMLAKKRPI
jgi:NADH-quinone oxidoreductase subunit J